MSVIYCHHCQAWSLFNDQKCQLCHFEQTYDMIDPDEREIFRIWGNSVNVIGRVDLIRQSLPRIGTLIEFENGLVFMPEVDMITPHFQDKHGDSDIKVSLFKKLWKSNQQGNEKENDFLTMGMSGYSIWEIPGSLFLDWSSIDKINQNQKSWSIFRTEHHTLTFNVISDLQTFSERMDLLIRKKLYHQE